MGASEEVLFVPKKTHTLGLDQGLVLPGAPASILAPCGKQGQKEEPIP